uniref:Uncharacterized protein n=1 Tax=Haemonchus contortus TaxID=6289 RepID=A0A7I4YDY5_HAECO
MGYIHEDKKGSARKSGVPSSINERRLRMPLLTPRNHQDAKRIPERPPAQCPGFFTKALNEGMLCLVSLKRVRSTGPLGLATGASGDVTGARSSKSMINGTTGGTGE